MKYTFAAVPVLIALASAAPGKRDDPNQNPIRV